MATGRVVNGRVELPADAFEEGAVVTVLAEDDEEETFVLSPDQERALEERLAEADRGELVSAEELLASLRRTA